MSFSHDVRNELARVFPEKKCCQRAELAALLMLRSTVVDQADGLYLVSEVENAATARKIYRLLKDSCQLPSTVQMEKQRCFKKNRCYRINTRMNQEEIWVLMDLGILDGNQTLKKQLNWSLVSKNCCKRAYLRGAFIARGFINRPEGNYHLEIVLNDSRIASGLQKLCTKLGIEARLSERKNNLVLYIKESEVIVDFLRLVEASRSLLEFENVRVIKSVRNQVNRQVNCETANLAKTVEASLRQVQIIKSLVSRMGWEGIPHQYRELARLRLEYPHSTLKEMGTMMTPPLTKSGVAYRMRQLESLAKEIEGKKSLS